MGKTIKLKNDTYIANELYSRNEHIIGTWIDGKPLYRKTTKIIINNSGESNIDIGIRNVETLVDVKGMYTYKGTDNKARWLPILRPTISTLETATKQCGFYVHETRLAQGIISFEFGANSGSYPITGYITAEYTKTTD